MDDQIFMSSQETSEEQPELLAKIKRNQKNQDQKLGREMSRRSSRRHPQDTQKTFAMTIQDQDTQKTFATKIHQIVKKQRELQKQSKSGQLII